MKAKKVYGTTILENMTSRVFQQARDRIDLLSKDPYGHTQFEIDALVSSIESQSDISALRNLSRRGTSDSVWKPAVREAFKAKKHSVLDEDCSHYDTRECGYRWEYKVATWAPSSNRFIASNPTFNPRVRVALFVADGKNFSDSGIYLLSHRNLRRFARPSAKNKGWQIALSREALIDPDGFGAFRLSFAAFAQTRMDMCACQ